MGSIGSAEIAALAAQLGVSPDGLRPSPSGWPGVMDGVLVGLHIGRPRALLRLDDFTALLPSGSDDLRVFNVEHVDGARLSVLPGPAVRAAAAAEQLGRRALERYAYRLGRFGLWLPVRHFAAWREADAACRARYFAVRDEIYREWDALIARSRARAERTCAEWNTPALLDAFRRRLDALDRDTFCSAWRWESELSLIPDAGQDAERVVERLRQMAELNAISAREEAMRQAAEAVAAQWRAGREQVIGDFLREVGRELHSLVCATCADLLDTLQAEGGLPGAKAVQLRRFVERVQELNVLDDQDLSAALGRARALLEEAASAPGGRRGDALRSANMDQIRELLAQVRERSEGILREIAPDVVWAERGMTRQPRKPRDEDGEALAAIAAGGERTGRRRRE